MHFFFGQFLSRKLISKIVSSLKKIRFLQDSREFLFLVKKRTLFWLIHAGSALVKVNKNRNDFMKTPFGPKSNVIIVRISALLYNTGWCICIWTIFESGCGIQMSQATPSKFSMLFKHNYD